MALRFHQDRNIYFEQQYNNTKKHILPFIAKQLPNLSNLNVLEIGCGEGGVLKVFYENGCNITGVDLATNKIENAIKYYADLPSTGSYSFLAENIYNIDLERFPSFDLIILKDTIEHIYDQAKLIGFLKLILNQNGIIFFAFPPWQMPWGGHQQICNNKIAAFFPYYHLLPSGIYKTFLELAGEPSNKIEHLLEIKETNMTIERFERIVNELKYNIINRKFYFINPNYEIKFGLKPQVQNSIIATIPYFRGFFTTTCFYLIDPIK